MEPQTDLIGRLEMLPIRQVFPKEAQHFTTWFEAHIEVLAERVGIPLTVIQREKEVGEFNVDLLCEDGEGKPVIIENQVERTDHDHLGKLLTYLVNLDASTAIWVTSEPRAEHQKVVDWLNESTPADVSFFLVKVEAVKIGDSPFAPLFTIQAAPDKQTKEVGEKKKEWAERHMQRYEFWSALLEKSREKTRLFSNISPGRYHWLGTGAGKSGLSFNLTIVMDWGGVELYIDHDKDTGQRNKAIFDAFYAERASIEKEFGGELEWERLDDKRACRIRKRFTSGGLTNTDEWALLQEQMIDAMIRLEKVLKPRIAKID
jgi:hypothetical protein